MKKLYRYEEDRSFEEYEDATKLLLVEFNVIKKTPAGYKISKYGFKETFILSGTNGKRFAYETKEAALKSFIIRKERQILHNKRAIILATHSLNIAKKLVL